MQHPSTHALARTRPGRPWTGAAAFVAAIHILFLYALITGLTIRIFKTSEPKIVVTRVLPEPPAKPSLPAPTPTMKEIVDTVPLPPPINIEQTDPKTITVIKMPEPPSNPTETAAPSESASGIAETHTIPEYPVLSRRLGEQGSVLLHIALADDGRIDNVNILHSSGYARLDEAAREWVMRYWRYRPATDNGKPVASAVEASVVFNLKTAQTP
ncbi:MAG TPA: energy transducer TonB [Rhizomicrobium sp.]